MEVKSLVMEMEKNIDVVTNAFSKDSNKFLTTVHKTAHMHYLHYITEKTQIKDVARKESPYYKLKTNIYSVLEKNVVSSKQFLCLYKRIFLYYYITTGKNYLVENNLCGSFTRQEKNLVFKLEKKYWSKLDE